MTIYGVLKADAEEHKEAALALADKYIRLIDLGAPSKASEIELDGYRHMRTAHAIEQALAELPREVAEREVE